MYTQYQRRIIFFLMWCFLFKTTACRPEIKFSSSGMQKKIFSPLIFPVTSNIKDKRPNRYLLINISFYCLWAKYPINVLTDFPFTKRLWFLELDVNISSLISFVLLCLPKLRNILRSVGRYYSSVWSEYMKVRCAWFMLTNTFCFQFCMKVFDVCWLKLNNLFFIYLYFFFEFVFLT